MRYIVTKGNKTWTMALMAVGLVAIIMGFISDAHRQWGNLLIGNFYLMGMALAGAFFLAVQYVAEVGWSAQLKRVFQAFGMYLPFAGICMIAIFIFGHHDLYHWTHHDLYDPNSPHYDEIMVGKSSYLNVPFFLTRVIAYFLIWGGYAYWSRKQSIMEDLDGDLKRHKKLIKRSALFLVALAVTSSTSAWDFIMSIDAHWYSTLFGWYTFIGMFISGLTMMTLVIVHLKRKGYLEGVTENHLHDMVKFMFAFSCFWTYLWFAQFMLIWYANIPEEITYFLERFDHYRPLFIANFCINFFVPFFALVSRTAKRKSYNWITFIGCLLIVGHWIDVFLMVTPGVNKHDWHIGFAEVGTTLFFLGAFLYSVFYWMSKAPLVPQKHPLLEESLHHEI